LDCENLNYFFLPFELGLELLILDTKVPRTLAASAYNKRVEECEQALNILYQTHQVRSFTDVKVEMLEAIQNKVLKKRAKHIVSEIERVELTSKYLSENNHIALGELLNQSHFSLRDDYEVSCDELDFITEYARNQTGCYGARMTGAGFGGCAIALIEPQYAESISQKISEFYQNEYGYFPSIYKSKPENGVRKL
jgi:galactokinase